MVLKLGRFGQRIIKKHLESYEMWCWRKMEISWTDHVSNEETLLQVKEQRNILHAIRKREANWIGLILRRNCLLKQEIEGKIKWKIEVTRIQGRRRRKLLDDLKDRTGSCHLEEETVDRNMWSDRFGRGFEPVVRLLDDDDMFHATCFDEYCTILRENSCHSLKTISVLPIIFSEKVSSQSLLLYGIKSEVCRIHVMKAYRRKNIYHS